jgi:hypothetical protein
MERIRSQVDDRENVRARPDEQWTGGAVNGTLHFFGFPDAPARVTVVQHDPAQRLRRALLALGACWGLAALTILVPIAHFVLVPGFFVLGIVLFVQRMREDATITGVEGVCPKCGEERGFVAGGRVQPHVKATCPVCRNELDLEISAPSAPAR